MSEKEDINKSVGDLLTKSEGHPDLGSGSGFIQKCL